MADVAESIEKAVVYLSEHPDEARYTDSLARATLDESLRVEVKGPNGERIVTDMPAAVGGRAEEPSPGWLFRAAMASCVASTVAMEAARDGVRLTSLEVEVDSESDDRGMLGIDESVPAGPLSTRIRIRARAEGAEDAGFRDVIERGAARCPVCDATKRAVQVSLASSAEDPAARLTELANMGEELFPHGKGALVPRLGQFHFNRRVGAFAESSSDVNAAASEVHVFPAKGGSLGATCSEGGRHVHEQSPERVLLACRLDDALNLGGGGDQPLRRAGFPGPGKVARIPDDLTVDEGVLERLSEDRVQSPGCGGSKVRVEGAQLTRVLRQAICIQVSDPGDIEPDPALVVSACSRGQVSPVIPVPVVHDFPNSETALDPCRRRTRRRVPFETTEEVASLLFRGEASPMADATDDPRHSILLSVTFDPVGPRGAHRPDRTFGY